MAKYIVLADLVVVKVKGASKTKSGVPQTTRLRRGATFDAGEGSDTVDALLGKGSIRQVKNKEEVEQYRHERYRQTARKAARSQGAPDDPVKAPEASATVDVLPVSPTGGNITPEELHAAPEADEIEDYDEAEDELVSVSSDGDDA